jgi:preprotein translocase subunit SecD
MVAKTRWWLLGILALVVVSVIGVTEPVKLRDRRNPETGQPQKPLRRAGPFRIYKPHFGLTLGLDLRGGMHLVLQAQNEGEFRYTFPALQGTLSQDKQDELYTQVVDALSLEKLAAPGQLPQDVKRVVTIDPADQAVVIRTRAGDMAEVNRQAKIIEGLLAAKFGNVKEKGDPKLNEISLDSLKSVRTILENRVNASGVAEPVIQMQPKQHRIIVELPGVKDPERAQEMIQKTAVLELRMIPRQYAYDTHRPIEDQVNGRPVYSFTDMQGNTVPASKVIDESPVIVTGRDLKPNSSDVVTAPGRPVAVTFTFQGGARQKFADFTRGHVRYYLGIVLDGQLMMAPVIEEPITTGKGEIKGGFNGTEGMQQARDLMILLNAGSLPFDLKYVENRTVSPELGADALRMSLIAGSIGMVAVLIFMVAYYRLPGLLADAALIIYCLLLLGAIKLVGQVLTLPGILAVIISIGMAVDANIIIFERLKEEIRSGKTLRSAVDAAFKRAWTAILDSNVCSIGTGIVLYIFGTGAVKGFAVALIIGVAVSLFTAVTVTRLFMNIAVEEGLGRNVALFGVSPKELERA